MKTSITIIIVIILKVSNSLQAQTEFPKLASYAIGAPHNYHDIWYQEQLAKRVLVILGFYNGWSQGGKTPAQVVNEIKVLNPNILVGNYTLMTETSDYGSADQVYRDKLNSELGSKGNHDWWARDNIGVKTDWSGGAWGGHDVNITNFVTPDANGDYWPQWLAKQDYAGLLQGVNFDIWFFDNNFWKPRSDPDWNGDGINDSKDSIPVRTWWRAGQRAHYDQAAIEAPNLLRIVNADSDLSGQVHPFGADIFTEYTNIFHGALLERMIGVYWSVEEWGGWENMMLWYYEIFNNLLNPKIILFDVLGAEDDYQTFRYAFASCLLNDGYFTFSSDTNFNSYNSLPWFDEYDLAGTGTTKWLGVAVDPPPLLPWQNGVFKRKFEKGMAIVNPKGNGQQTVTVEAGFKRIAGTQDPVVNSGQPAHIITLDERDGIILAKTSPTGIEQQNNLIPNQFRLMQNYPNPFNPTTTIRYGIPHSSQVDLSIYDLLGRKLTTLINKQQPAGWHTVQWSGVSDKGQSVSSGIYIMRLESGVLVDAKIIMLMK